VSRDDDSEFLLLVGVADSSTYGGSGEPSWDAPPAWQVRTRPHPHACCSCIPRHALSGSQRMQEKCYFADLDNPAADVAAQAATALAINARLLQRFGNGAADNATAAVWTAKSVHAYRYAKAMWTAHGDKATCTLSSSRDNCIGSGCTTTADDGGGVRAVRSSHRDRLRPRVWPASLRVYTLTRTATEAPCGMVCLWHHFASVV
jgi:hypothetical protein